MKKLNLCIAIALIAAVFCACKPSKDNDAPAPETDGVPSTGLVGYFPFNANAHDESGNHNNGVVDGATLTTDIFNNANSAYSFDGGDNIEIPDTSFFNDMDAFSISVWVNPTTINQHNTIISKVSPNRDFNLKIADNNQYEGHFAHAATYYRCYSNTSVALNTWTHVVYQWTGTKLKMFINGALADEVDHTGVKPLWTGAAMAIGSMDGGEFFTGKIDNVRIYNRVLSTTEIETLYQEKQ